MVGTLSLGSYLALVEYSGRLFRNSKAQISAGVKDIFERLGTSEEYWGDRIKKMMLSRELRGCFFGVNPEGLAAVTAHRGHRTANLTPQLPD